MANWLHTLNLKDLWDKYRNVDHEDITGEQAEESGKAIASRLHSLADKLPTEYQEEAHDLACDFGAIDSMDELDNAMDNLWDLGDTALPTPLGQMQRKLIWVKTF